MGIRTTIQEQVIDRAQYLVDSRPRRDYQPLPWIGATRSTRAQGSSDRWNLIRPELERLGPASAVDIGCNFGFFALSMAERGIATVGIESERRFVRIAQHAARKAGFTDVAFLGTTVTPSTTWQIPSADVVLLLSVYHHWVRHYGPDDARAMLADTWARAGMALFFDTGENELPSHFAGLDMGSSPGEFLRSHLEEICEGGEVRLLGTSRAFAPGRGDERSAPAQRHLFIVERP